MSRIQLGAASIAAPVVFVGAMASGKSRIGKRLATRLSVSFIDTDKVIAAEHGPISEIFAQFGESHFRKIEAKVVANSLASDGVVSLGGGAVVDEGTRKLLQNCSVVWLQISADAVAQRLVDSSRPLLATGGLARWAELLELRTPYYSEVSSVTVNTSHRTSDQSLDDVEEALLKLAESESG